VETLSPTSMLLLLALFPIAATHGNRNGETDMPLPFTRTLRENDTGNDVVIAQNLLRRSPYVPKDVNFTSGVFDKESVLATTKFQSGNGLADDGVVGVDTAQLLLDLHTKDNYSHISSLPDGYSYLITIDVFSDRDKEVNATLFGKDDQSVLQPVHTFRVRLHGKSYAPNQFSRNGDTPTGLAEIDLNTPEDDVKDFGPYPINRFVRGLDGNLGFLVPHIRNGLLVHTGEWAGWTPDKPMPNSDGCVHGHPTDIDKIAQILQEQLHVKARNNTFGQLPYPYKPQGLISIQEVNGGV